MASTQKDLSALERARNLRHVPWCDDYEAMISGMAYRPWESPDLKKAQSRAAALYQRYNDSAGASAVDTDVAQERAGIVRDLLGSVGEMFTIDAPFSVVYGCNLSVGKNFYANIHLAIDDSALISIGDNVLIGPSVQFITINHPTDVAQRLQGVMYTRPIVVEDACWIGARVTILPGAVIRYGCTIGAGAVVSGEIPEYSVAVGVPARPVKRVSPTDTRPSEVSSEVTPEAHASDQQS